MNHTLVNPPVDRHREIHEVEDVFIHAVKETTRAWSPRREDGATGSAFSNYNFVSYHGSTPIKRPEYAISFFAPMNAPGIKLLCRPSYEFMAATLGSPFDYPLSSRFDENDAVLVFEDALIPWENFLINGNIEIASTYHLTGSSGARCYRAARDSRSSSNSSQACSSRPSRRPAPLEFRGIQASIGEIIAWRNMFWALTDSMCHNPVPSAGGSVLPNIEAASAYRILSNQAYPAIKAIIENQTGGALIVRPSSSRDWKEPELRPLFDQFYRGSNGYAAEDKIKLDQPPLGCDRQRVRWPPRAVRALVLGQPRADEARVLLDGTGRRHGRPHEGLRRAVHGRIRPRRLDGAGPDQQRRRQHSRP